MRKIFLAAALAFTSFMPGIALGWPAQVLNVHDGDTLSVAPSGDSLTPVFVRLYGIDAPELKQRGGAQAREKLAELLPNAAVVEIISMGVDQYGRVIALVAHNGGVINGRMVGAGHAWVREEACKASVCRSWLDMQQKASQEHRGLWAFEKPVPPWQWRQGEQAQGHGGAGASPAPANDSRAADRFAIPGSDTAGRLPIPSF